MLTLALYQLSKQVIELRCSSNKTKVSFDVAPISLEKLPEAVSEFDETLWGSLVDYVTVGKDKTMTFTLIGGTEMKA